MICFYSFVYKSVRLLVKSVMYSIQFFTNKPKDLEDAVLFGHKLLYKLTTYNLIWSPNINLNNSLKRSIYDLNFDNPLTFASYESNLCLLSFFYKLGISGGCYKTMMNNSRDGNSRPRLQEVLVNRRNCLINAMGLPGPGASSAIKSIIKSSLLTYNRPLGLSLGGESPAGYYDSFLAYNTVIDDMSYPFYYELNISCPNTEKGKHLTSNIELLESLVKKIRRSTNRVISVKVSPDQTNYQIQQIADMLLQFDCIIMNAGNTQFKSTSQVELKKGSISIGGGGLSGDALFNRTKEMIVVLAPFKLPIIATGGISSYSQVKTCLDSGANLIGMATALVFNPYCIPKILKQL
jgi:dihydroorotate dehydrogenase